MLAALDLTWADLGAADRQNGNGIRNGRAEIVATYDYVDEGGTLLFQVIRRADKTFAQRRPDGVGGWVWKLNGTRRVLYRLPTLLAALADGREVYVVEGEKDVHGVVASPGHASHPPGMDSASDASCPTRVAPPIRFLDHPGRLPFRVYRDEAGRLLRTVVRAVAVPRKSQ